MNRPKLTDRERRAVSREVREEERTWAVVHERTEEGSLCGLDWDDLPDTVLFAPWTTDAGGATCPCCRRVRAGKAPFPWGAGSHLKLSPLDRKTAEARWLSLADVAGEAERVAGLSDADLLRLLVFGPEADEE